jgi:putative peptide zinc metalloprotease protein
MQESAFVDPPWLIEREGAGYIQVTRLLYQVAEACDGQHTLEEIASEVSQQAGRKVSADNVRQLIVRQLVPRGLIAIPGLELPSADGARSPLALNMRMRMVSPEAISPVTSVLKVLYWPPVLLLVLLVAAAAEGWIYLVHGVGGSVHDALYAPGLMVVVIGVIVVSAAFHELGHATALDYAGGKIKGMGAGLYTVYPAFFTDVSDNYRLPRWSRVRTDLGGFYFNLIFGLAIFGVYLLTSQEFLLVIVVMINLEIIHQLLPFLRLDGYWTLADLTGVPDFFSQMGAFVRSTLPIKRWKGRKLPPMKWWGKLVFAIYMLVTVPLLVVVLVLMVKSVPRVLATALDSFGHLEQAFGQTSAQADGLGMVSAAAQMFFLALPILGLCYTLFSLARRLIVGVWTWSKPSWGRRLIGTLGVGAAAAAVAVMWAPQLPFGGGAPGPWHDSVRFEPIGPTERGTVGDAVAGVVATREPTSTATAVPTPTAGAGTPEASPTAAPNQTPRAATPAATSTGPTAVPTSNLAPVAPASKPGATPAATAASTAAARTPAATLAATAEPRGTRTAVSATVAPAQATAAAR